MNRFKDELPVRGAEAPILADDSGRRRRRLRVLGRALSGMLILWLGVLGLGALGLQPLGGVPGLGLAPERARPSKLPVRIEAAVREHRVIALSSPVVAGVPVDMPTRGAVSPARPLRRRGPGTARPPRGSATPGDRGALQGTTTRPVGPQPPAGSGTAPTRTTPVAPSGAGTVPAQTTPVAPGRSGTTPAQTTPAPPESPGRSGTTRTQPDPPARSAPAGPSAVDSGPPVTTATP
jgi:hypothetical protein